MSRWVAAVALLLALTPLAAAQVPEPPEPGEVLAQACALAPVDLPVCPQEEPAGAAPQNAGEEHEHADPPAPPATPQDAEQLAEEAREEVEAVAEDPASAPGRVASLAATVLQFVKDLLDLPAQGVDALDATRVEAAASVGAIAQSVKDGAGGAAASLKDAVAGAVDGVKAALADLFAREAAPVSAERDLPARAPGVGDASGLVGGLLGRVDAL